MTHALLAVGAFLALGRTWGSEPTSAGAQKALTQAPPRPSASAGLVKRRLVTTTGVTLLDSLAWIGGTERLVGISQRPDVQLYMPSVVLADTRSGKVTTLAQGKPGLGYWYPAASPDGRRLAYGAFQYMGDRPPRAGLWIRSLEDGSVRRITAMVPGKIEWTPDGQQLVFVGSRDQHGLWCVRPDGGGLKHLSDQFVADLALSGDGQAAVYMVWKRPGFELWTAPLSGTGRQRVATDAWSPSLRANELWYVADHTPYRDWESGLNGFGRTLRRTHLRTKTNQGAIRARNATLVTRARVSPDGARLWALTVDDSLWVVNSDGTGWRRLAERARGAAWSADAKRLAWSEFRRGLGALCVAQFESRTRFRLHARTFRAALRPQRRE